MDHNGNRERLAWMLLIAGFLICAIMTVATPLMARAAVTQAQRPLALTVQSNGGTVVLRDRAGSRALLPGNPPDSMNASDTVLTNVSDTALMLVYTPDSSQLLARVQVYGNTALTVEEAHSPRFGISSSETLVRLKLARGRLRVKLFPVENTEKPPVVIEVETPHGMVDIRHAGQYSLEAGSNSLTQVSVQEGMASLTHVNQTIPIFADQRATVNGDRPPAGPLNTERDLIRNGDFDDELNNWVLLAWEVERAGQPGGSARVSEISDDAAFYVRRDGIGHAEVSLRQTVDQDVTDFDSLRLLLSLRINEQSLGVCGVQGSECPLTIRIEYDDGSGNSRIWQQGLYATGEIDPNATPDICITCATAQRAHQRVPLGQLYFYETDLLHELAQQGALPPSRISSISLVVAGHTFEVAVVDVALVGKE